jgi:hypothetical protein
MSQVPKIVWARLQAGAVEAHPDADVLTAFYEQALPENERGAVLAHLAQCSDCRDVVALAMPDVAVERSHQPVERAAGWGWPLFVRWGSVVACMVVVGAAVMIYRPAPVAVRPTSEAEVVIPEESHATAASADQNLTDDKTASGKVAGSELTDKVAAQPTQPVALAKEARAASTRPVESGKKFERVPAPAPQVEARSVAQSSAAIGVIQKKQAAAFEAPRPGGAVGGMIGNVVPSAPAPAADSGQPEKEATVAEVQAPEVPAEMKAADTPGRAKVGTANAVSASEQDQKREKQAILADSYSKTAQAGPAGVPAMLATTPAMWTLSPDGQLQRSVDRGQSWHPAPLLEQAKFTAVSAIGLDIWVGGAAGLLYHSTNSGVQWTLMKPTASGVALTGDISDVRFTNPQHGTVTTTNKEEWTTSDSGATWQKKP